MVLPLCLRPEFPLPAVKRVADRAGLTDRDIGTGRPCDLPARPAIGLPCAPMKKPRQCAASSAYVCSGFLVPGPVVCGTDSWSPIRCATVKRSFLRPSERARRCCCDITTNKKPLVGFVQSGCNCPRRTPSRGSIQAYSPPRMLSILKVSGKCSGADTPFLLKCPAHRAL